MTIFIVNVDKNGHILDHLPTSSCLRPLLEMPKRFGHGSEAKSCFWSQNEIGFPKYSLGNQKFRSLGQHICPLSTICTWFFKISISRNWFLNLIKTWFLLPVQPAKIQFEIDKKSSSKIKFKNQFREIVQIDKGQMCCPNDLNFWFPHWIFWKFYFGTKNNSSLLNHVQNFWHFQKGS